MAERSDSPTSSESGSIFCGVGSPRPKPRVLNANFFGYVPDAFDSKSLKVGEEAPADKRKRLAKEAEERAKEEEEEEERRKQEEEEAAQAEEEVPEEVEVEEEVAGPLPVSEAVSKI